MANKRILVLQDQVEGLCRNDLKYRVVGSLGSFVLVEELAPEETDEIELER